MKRVTTTFTLFLFIMVILRGENVDALFGEIINNGNLSEAKRQIMQIIDQPDVSDLTKAIAYKHLGTICFRLGGEFLSSFSKSESIFKLLLTSSPSNKIYEEYSLMLFQRGNCCVAACEQEIYKSKLQGIPIIPFELVKQYLAPAEKDLANSKMHYPSAQVGDLMLLSLELSLARFHIWSITNQAAMAEKAGRESLLIAEEGMNSDNLAPDAYKKLLLKYATALVEINGSSGESLTMAISILQKGMGLKSGNVELDASLVSLWAKLLISSSEMTDMFAMVENRLVSETESLERLRATNVVSMDFMARKEYFSSRTGMYEVLVELYAKQKKPFDMLKTINRMRSRSIQDYINDNEVIQEPESEKELCQILKDSNGMLVAYFIATDTVWLVLYTSEGGRIAHTQLNGQEIAYLTTQTLGVFSSVNHLQAFFSFGPVYQPVNDAFKASNVLYQELFEQAHELFAQKRLSHLFILPHNILNYFPFGAMVIQPNESNILQSLFVADTGLSITYLPSLSALLDIGRISLTINDTMVFVRSTYSYPAYYNNNPANPDDTTTQSLNLSNVPLEGRQVSQLLKTKSHNYYAEHQASEYNLMTQTSQKPYSIVHIASHAHLDRNSPLDSYVVLAASKTEDGKVKVRELLTRYQGKMQVGLLVLSACDTNRGETSIQPGDDIAALSNAFMVAGADNVIATQWPASDSSFPRIMTLFYDKLCQGEPLDTALSQAQKTFLGQNHGAMRFPIFWANIVLNGKRMRCM